MNPTVQRDSAPPAVAGDPATIPFGANGIRLSPRDWMIAVALFASVLVLMPALWKRVEPFEPSPDYRLPYALSEDYWWFQRAADAAGAGENRIAVVGDSVVWGQYTSPAGALPQALNTALDRETFVNLGLNGSHPVALYGLMRHYGAGLRDGKVILHFNPLWMSSPRRDLQSDRPVRFNHPELVPQFVPRIPSYDAGLGHRLGVAIGHRVGVFPWLKHLRLVYFDRKNLPAWTTENPYKNPLARLRRPVPTPAPKPPGQPVPWTEKDIQPLSFDWVAPANSLQWHFFRRTVRLLQARNNTVFVLVGPLNTHMLDADSRVAYEAVLREITAWLDEAGIPSDAPAVLPAPMYADTSHPLANGYARWAEQLINDPAFSKFHAMAGHE